MKTSDAGKFKQIYSRLMKTYGRSVDPATQDVWWELMQDLSIEQFAAACVQYMATERAWPVPAAIRDLAGVNANGWPTPEEAWNMLPKSEYESGWMCQETITAYTACSDSIERGDMIGARMCFLEVYKREIKGKRGEPKWWISWGIGDTQEQRESRFEQLCLEKPMVAARLTRDQTPSGLLSSEIGSVPMLPSSRSTESGFKRLSGLTGSTSLAKKPLSN